MKTNTSYYKSLRALLASFGYVALLAVVPVTLVGCSTVAPTCNTATEETPTFPIPQSSQFETNEAMAMIELCVDLDSQDDRAVPGHSPIYNMRKDRYANWEKILDSRDLVAEDLHLAGTNKDNPVINGFKPFDSAWTLWKNTNSLQPVYALAFRGTIFSNQKSAEEDAIATTIAAQYGIEYPAHRFLPVTFAKLPRAEVHEGFAYAIFGVLFDGRYGVLTNVNNVIEPGSTLIITGHSQGAALATLAHAFFYYAAEEGRFHVAEMNLKIKSYVFAQPKPGNVQFAMDFAQITGGGATSFVFNNTLDPVPMLPPTHLFAAEAFEDVRSRKSGFKILRSINNSFNSMRRGISGWVSHSMARKIKHLQKTEPDGFYFAKALRDGSTNHTAGGVSQSYTLAGNMIPLRGLGHGSKYYNNPQDEYDDFIQHHSTTYRRLLETLYGYEATTAQNAK
jgi:hypothetical protein